MGRRENAASRTPHTDSFRYENAASPHSSFRAKARHLLRSRPRKDVRGAGNGKPSAPCAPEERCFMQTAPRGKENTANEKDPSAPLGMTIRETAFLIFPFIPRREPTSAPSGRLLPLEGGGRPLHRLLIQMAFDTRMPLPRIRHFERKREIFFVRGKAKDVRGTASGKPPAPCALKNGVSCRPLHAGKRIRQTKKIPRLRSG